MQKDQPGESLGASTRGGRAAQAYREVGWNLRVMLTGAKGQVGQEMSRAFSERRIASEMAAMSRSEMDFTQREQVYGAVVGFEPQVIIHLGAMTAVDLCEEEPDSAYLANAISTRYLKQAARLVGAKMVYLSTDYVFDGHATQPYREWDATNPISVYGRSKLAGESELEPSDLVIRTSWVMGRYGKNILKTILGAAKGTSELRFVDDQIGSPTVAADLANAVISLVLEGHSGLFHLSNSGSLSWYELVRFIFGVIGADASRIVAIDSAELAMTRKAARPQYSVLDNCAWRLSGFATLPHYSEAVGSLALELWREM